MTQYVNGWEHSFVAGAAIAKGVAVKLSSGKVVAAGLGEEFIGFAMYDVFADGDDVAVFCKGPSIVMKAAGAFSAGAVLYVRANGLVDDNSGTSALRAGIGLEAATAANDLVQVLWAPVS